jgi:hypothetical protein
MKNQSILVRAFWDDEARVWVASSSDIAGLAVEADTIEALEPKVLAAISDLVELNGLNFDLPDIPVHIFSEQIAKVANPRM